MSTYINKFNPINIFGSNINDISTIVLKKYYNVSNKDNSQIHHTDLIIDDNFIKNNDISLEISLNFLRNEIKNHDIDDEIINDNLSNIIELPNKYFTGIIAIIKYSFKDNNVYKITIENFKSSCSSVNLYGMHDNIIHLIDHSTLNPNLHTNINFIDTHINALSHIKYIIIKSNDVEKFTFGNVMIELYNDFGDDKVLHASRSSQYTIYKNTYKKLYNVACILDSFSFECFSYELNLFQLSLNNWENILKSNIDFVLMESAWVGYNGEWENIISNYDSRNMKDIKMVELSKMMDYIITSKIPMVFYNREDPVNFDKFINFAKLFSNNLIVTVDENSVINYKKAGCRYVLSFPFCCQPIIHNPINKQSIYDIIFSTHYDTLSDECNEINDIIDNHINCIDIYDEQLLNNKLALQVKSFDEFKHRYEFPEKYKNNIKGNLEYTQLLEVVKKYKIVVTNSFKSLIEMCSMSIPVMSNQQYKNIFGSNILNYQDKDTINKYLQDDMTRRTVGNTLHKITMKNYTYGHLIDKIIDGICINKRVFKTKSILCLIFSETKMGITKQSYFSKTHETVFVIKNITPNEINKMNSTNNIITYDNIHLIKEVDYYFIMNASCVYSQDYIDNILLPFSYTDALIVGKGAYARNRKNNILNIDLEHTFTNKLNLNAIVIKHSDITRKLLNKSIFDNIKIFLNTPQQNKLYSTDFDDFIDMEIIGHQTMINNVILQNLTKNANSQFDQKLKIVMSCFKVGNIGKIILNLNAQTTKLFNLFIWNNNKNEEEILIKNIIDAKPEFDVWIYTSNENIGGIGKFYMTSYLLKKYHFDKVMFVDDDQILGHTVINQLINLNIRDCKNMIGNAYCWYGRIFNKKNYDQGINMGFKNYEKLSYGATGGMIIDTNVFRDNNFYSMLPAMYNFIEDMWLSYYAQTKHKYKFMKIHVDIGNMDEKYDQYKNVWDNKDKMLKYCRGMGWDV